MADKRFSILHPLDRCYVCGTKENIHIHEVFHGTANRRKSIKWGCCVGLCGDHHNLTKDGVHSNKELDLKLKKEYQEVFEEMYGHTKFMQEFHKNYL